MEYDDYDLETAARMDLFAAFGKRFKIAACNVEFESPKDGGMYLKYDYVPAERIVHSLDRKCISIIGMCQVMIIFKPGSGTEKARALAKEIANTFYDGKILSVGYVYSGGESKPQMKTDGGWVIPVRFYVRYDGVNNI